MEFAGLNLLLNAGGARRVILNGREYLVAPITGIVPGVLAGSQGALWYPPEQIARNHQSWDGVPIVGPTHPHHNGYPVSARHPAVAERFGIGTVYSTKVDNAGKLKHEGWFDAEKTKRVDPRIYEALINGQQMEISSGLFTDNVGGPGVAPKEHGGRPYDATATNYRPDHVAVLPDQRGACSLSDGCGLNVNAAHIDTEDAPTNNPFVSREQQKACYAKDDPDWDCHEWSHAPGGFSDEKVRAGKVGKKTDNANPQGINQYTSQSSKEADDKSDVAKTASFRASAGRPSKEAKKAASSSRIAYQAAENGDHENAENNHLNAANYHGKAAFRHEGKSSVAHDEARKAHEVAAKLHRVAAGLHHDARIDEGTHNAAANQPRHMESGQYLNHGAGTGRGEVHGAAKNGHATLSMCAGCGKPGGLCDCGEEDGMVGGMSGTTNANPEGINQYTRSASVEAMQKSNTAEKLSKKASQIDNKGKSKEERHSSEKPPGSGITVIRAVEHANKFDHEKASSGHKEAATSHEDSAMYHDNHVGRHHERAAAAHREAAASHREAAGLHHDAGIDLGTQNTERCPKCGGDMVDGECEDCGYVENALNAEDQPRDDHGRFAAGGASQTAREASAKVGYQGHSRRASVESDKAQDAVESKEGSKLHEGAARAHMSAAREHRKQQGIARMHDPKLAEQHQQAAQAHETAMASHFKASNSLKKSITKNIEVEMTKQQAIGILTANCRCDSDRRAVQNLSDDLLFRMAVNATKSVMMETDSENVNEDAEEGDDGDEDDPSMPRRNDGGGHTIGPIGVGVGKPTGRPAIKNPTTVVAPQPPKPPMPPGAPHINGARPMTENEWLAAAPPEVRERDRMAQRILSREKAMLVRRLVANVADPDRQQAVANRLMRHDYEDLLERVELMGPVGNQHEPEAAPMYYGGAGMEMAPASRLTENESAEVLDIGSARDKYDPWVLNARTG